MNLRDISGSIYYWINNLDIVFSVLTLITGSAILYLSFSAGIGQYGMGLAFLAGTFAYLYLRNSRRMKGLDGEIADLKPESSHKTLLLLLNTIFLLCFSASIYILHQAIYIRPPIYFILVTAAYLSIFIEMLYINKESFAYYLNIPKVVLLSLSFRMGRYFAFPTIPGTDTQYHLKLANLISQLGHVPSYEVAQTQYAYTPLWHIFVSSTGILLDVDSSKMLFFSIVLPFTIIISLFSFLIVKKIANVQTALMGVLFINIADMLLVRGTTNINTSSLVHILLFLILFCLIQRRNRIIFSAFILIAITDMVLTHQLSTFCVLIICFSLLVSKPVYNFLSQYVKGVKELPLNINSTIFMYFLIFLIFYWSMMGEGGTTFFDSMVLRLRRSLLQMLTEYTSAVSYVKAFSTFDVWSSLLYNLGYSILLGLAIVGLLLWLNREHISLIRFSHITAAISLFLVIYVGTYIGLNMLFIPHRFISFLEVFLVIFAAYSVYMTNRLYTKPKSRILLCFIITALIFFMITTPYVNRNDPLYCNKQEYRVDYTASEVESAVWAISHSGNETIYKDCLFSMNKLLPITNIDLSGKSVRNYPQGIATDAKRLAIVRQYFERTGGIIFYMGTFGKGRVVDTSQFLSNVTKNWSLVFSCGVTNIYYK